MDLHTRNVVRRYLADPTPENASRAMAALARVGALAEVGSPDMALSSPRWGPEAPAVDQERSRGNVLVLDIPGRRLCYSYGRLVAVADWTGPEDWGIVYFARGYSVTSSKHALAFVRRHSRLFVRRHSRLAQRETDPETLTRLARVLPTEEAPAPEAGQ